MSQSKNKRIDQLLTDLKYFSSRQKAVLAIRSGGVIVNNILIDKPGKLVPADSLITIKHKMPFVSRGGLKLQKALDEFRISVKNKIAIDIGCSTGGFTDCLLQYGAKLVYALDVGYGQLDLKLRNDPRVILMEKTNARFLKPHDLGKKPDIAVIDVSFISLDKIFSAVKNIISSPGEIIALIKPQFEAGPKKAKKGVIKDPKIHNEVIEKIKKLADKYCFEDKGVIASPITGPAGNKEFLIYLRVPVLDRRM